MSDSGKNWKCPSLDENLLEDFELTGFLLTLRKFARTCKQPQKE